MNDPNEIKKNIVVESDGRWRRLTPHECARLQGLSETFKLPQSNSKAYRQLGNNVAVSVVRAIAKNLIEALRNSQG